MLCYFRLITLQKAAHKVFCNRIITDTWKKILSLLNIYPKRFLLHSEARLAPGQRKNNSSDTACSFLLPSHRDDSIHSSLLFAYQLFLLYVSSSVLQCFTCCSTMKNDTPDVCLMCSMCDRFCSSTRTWMFGLDCYSDDGRSFKVEWCEGRAGRRCWDGGRFENEFLHSTNTCRDTNNIKQSCIQKTSQTVSNNRILNLRAPIMFHKNSFLFLH